MVFNPNLDAAPTPESPVYTNVSAQAAGGMGDVAANALGVLGGLITGGVERREARQARELRQNYINGLEGIRSRVNEGDINGASIAAGNLISSYVAAGGEWDTEARAVATAVTGLPERMFGVSQTALAAEDERQRRSALRADETFQAYLFLEEQANPNASEAELFNAAEQRINRRNANEVILAEAEISGQMNYEAEGREAVFGVIDDFYQAALGSLVNSIESGEVVDPRAVDSARIQFNALRRRVEASLYNVSEDQRAEVERQFEQVENTINNVETLLSSEGQLERARSFMSQLIVAGNLSEDSNPVQALGAFLALEDMEGFFLAATQSGPSLANNPELVRNLMEGYSLSFTDFVRQQAAEQLPELEDGTRNPNGIISSEELPVAVREQIATLNDRNITSELSLNGRLFSTVNAQNVTNPATADMFIRRAYETGAYMLSTEGRPLTPALVQQLGLGPQLGENFNVLESVGLDSEGEVQARVTLRSGILTQISAQQRYLNRIEQVNDFVGLRWNEQTSSYEVTDPEFIEGWARLSGVSVAAMTGDNGAISLPSDPSLYREGWRLQLWQRVNNIDELYSYRESINSLQGAFDSLETEVPEDQGAIPVASDFVFTSQTRAQLPPTEGMLNISMDFNASPSGNARGTEVIIPDNASPEVRAAAEEFNRLVADFAARNGIEDYPVRGVRTRSENGRGIRNTVHAEPFFNTDTAMQEAIRANPAEFAAIYAQAFGSLSGARVIAPHGEGNDRGATSEIFGDETSFGELMAQSFTGDVGDIGATAPRGRRRPAGQTPRPAGGGMGLQGPIEDMLPPPAPAPQAQTEPMGLDIGMTASAMEEDGTPAVDMSAGDAQPTEGREAPERPSEPVPDAPPPAQIARNLEEIARGAQENFGEDNTVAGRAMALAQRISGGEEVDYSEVYALLTEALRLPATAEKRRLVNDLYDLAEQMRGQ